MRRLRDLTDTELSKLFLLTSEVWMADECVGEGALDLARNELQQSLADLQLSPLITELDVFLEDLRRARTTPVTEKGVPAVAFEVDLHAQREECRLRFN